MINDLNVGLLIKQCNCKALEDLKYHFYGAFVSFLNLLEKSNLYGLQSEVKKVIQVCNMKVCK